MTRRAKRLMLVMLGVGLVARLVMAFVTVGQPFDIRSSEIVTAALHAPGHLYSTVNRELDFGDISGILFRWPYPPVFIAWLWVADHLSSFTGLPFHGILQIPAILAD